MEYTSFTKRLLNAIPNYIIVFILFNLLSAFLIIDLGLGKGDMQMAPFVIMVMSIVPLDFVVGLIMYPDGYGHDLITYIFLFIVMLSVETIYFTIIDVLAIKKSNRGKMSSMTLQDRNGDNPGFFKIFIRNILKAISRVLLMLPFLTLFFTEKRQTLYDKMTNIVVVVGGNK